MTDPSRLFGLRVHNRAFTPPICITAYDANRTDPQTGHMFIDVVVRQGGRTIFGRGQLWCAVNRWTTIDGIEARALVMCLVAMKPGDTDSDYFAHYTAEQLEWARTYGDGLSCERERRYCDENGNVKRGKP